MRAFSSITPGPESRGSAAAGGSASVCQEVDGWTPVSRDEDLLALDQALSKLATVDPRAAGCGIAFFRRLAGKTRPPWRWVFQRLP